MADEPVSACREPFTHLNQARLVLEPLVAAEPDRADDRGSLALCLSNREPDQRITPTSGPNSRRFSRRSTARARGNVGPIA